MTAGSIQERLARDQQILDEILKISCPTLGSARGAERRVLREKASNFAGALPDGRWVKVADASHTIQSDNPAGLLDALNPFIEEIGL